MKYWQTHKNFLQRHITYPARIIVWGITDVINFMVFPFLWLAVYGDRTNIAGFTRADIVSYYIIMALISLVFTSHIAKSIQINIMKGGLSSFLVKPMNFLIHEVLHEISYRIVTLFIGIPIIVFLFLVFPKYLLMPTSLINFFFFLFSLLFSLLLSSLIQKVIGFAVFWMGETGALESLRHILSNVFSGKLAPLVFYPILLQNISNWLPFKYMYYFPFQVYTGKINNAEIINGFGIVMLWSVILSVFVYFLWRRGLKRYEGVGI